MDAKCKIVPLQLRHVVWTAVLLLCAWALAAGIGFVFFYLTSPVPR